MSLVGSDPRSRLLAAQAMLLGLFMGLLVIPASSIFLGTYGAENLPWTYITIAVGAMAGTPLLARAVGRWTLAQIGVPLWLVLATFVLTAWMGIEWFDAAWFSAPLFVLFPLGILIGFFFLGGQAGRMFDLREMKENFPRVVVGFPLGFLISGLLGDVLIGVLGNVARLLPVAAASGVGFAALIGSAARRFPDELAVSPRATTRPETSGGAAPGKSAIRHVLSNRYIVILLAYQMLSQLGTQLVDFLLFERAAARYPGEQELGRFIARYNTALNLLDLVFLLVVAAVLLRRFGMRVGLTVNPLVVTVCMVAAVVAAGVSGIGAVGPFALIAVARALDIAFTDGATRTALNTAYQAVPASERLAVQATIEGFGVPIALGVTGVLLLVLQQGLGVGAFGVSVLAVGVGVVWTVSGAIVFRSYRSNLREGLEARVLSPTGLDLDDAATIIEIDRMLGSGDDRQVWAALTAFHSLPDRADRLAVLASSTDDRVAEVAFTELQTLDPGRALAVAASLTDSPTPGVRFAAAAALAREDGGHHGFRQVEDALDDADRGVRAAARRAAAMSGHTELVAKVVEASRSDNDPVSAVNALSAAGDALAPFAAEALGAADGRHTIRLLRCLPPSPVTAELLVRHVDHPDHDVAIVVRQVFARAGGGPLPASSVDELLAADAARAARTLEAMTTIPTDGRFAVLQSSLASELDITERSVLATLGLAIDPALVLHVARSLRSRDDRVIARAVETIELHLDGRRARLCIPLIDRRLSSSERLAALRAVTDVPSHDLADTLADLVDDRASTWRRPWLRTCAAQTRATLAV